MGSSVLAIGLLLVSCVLLPAQMAAALTGHSSTSLNHRLRRWKLHAEAVFYLRIESINEWPFIRKADNTPSALKMKRDVSL
jgi:hypothetical protein